jgi:methyltransferase
MSGAVLLLTFVTLQRLGELLLARRNTARLISAGGVEFGQSHYPLVVALHAIWLAGLWWLAPAQPVHPAFVAAFAALQVARAWTIASLGSRWTTRVIVLPGAAPVTCGPYRFLQHPNYVIVAAEIAVVPLALGLALYAAVFSLLNAIVLTIRIRVENAALAASDAAR